MKIQNRSYAGKYFLPKPVVEFDSTADTLFVATAWGDSSAAKFAIETLKERAINVSSDTTEVTRLKHVEPVVDQKVGLLKSLDNLNQQLIKKYNDTEYTASVEILALERSGSLISWTQVGAPAIYIFDGQTLSPVSQQVSIATQYKQMSPMAYAGLGVFPSFNVCSGSFRLNEGESVVLLSRDLVPSSLFAVHSRSMEGWADVLASADVDRPFWLAQVNL